MGYAGELQGWPVKSLFKYLHQITHSLFYLFFLAKKKQEEDDDDMRELENWAAV